jgi:hypothetical protein
MSATGEGDAPEDLSSSLGISASRMAHEPPLFSGSEAIPLGPDAALGVAATGPY